MCLNIVVANCSENIECSKRTFNRDYFTFHLRRKIFTRFPRGPIDLS